MPISNPFYSNNSFPLWSQGGHNDAMINFAHAGGAMSAAFFGSAVEAVEAMTIVLAAGIIRGWGSAAAGSLAAAAAHAAVLAATRTAGAGLPVRPLPLPRRSRLLPLRGPLLG